MILSMDPQLVACIGEVGVDDRSVAKFNQHFATAAILIRKTLECVISRAGKCDQTLLGGYDRSQFGLLAI